MSNQVSILAERLDSAAYKAAATPQLEAPISLEDAYAVQRASIERRIARGEKRIGIKMGFTSSAKRVQMGVSDLLLWRITSALLVAAGGSITLSRYVHPRS